MVTSPIILSLWGDQTLFFKHQRIDDDLEYFPWWKDYIQTWTNGKMNETELIDPPPEEKCPFAFLFTMNKK